MNIQISSDVKIPDGYEAVRIDYANKGDCYYNAGEPWEWTSEKKSGRLYLILKKTEPKRWRASKDDHYWYVDGNLNVVSISDRYSFNDNFRYNNFNYFKTGDQAQEVANKVKGLFKESKKFTFIYEPQKVEKKVKPERRIGKKYWYIENYKIGDSVDVDDMEDNYRYNNDKYYCTREEAREALKKLKVNKK